MSTLNSIDPQLSIKGDVLREEGLLTHISYAALVFLVANLTKDKDQGVQLLKSLVLATIFISIYGLVQYFGYNPTEHFLFKPSPGKVSSTMGNPNFLGKYLVLTIPIILSFYLQYPHSFLKYLLATGTLFAFSCLIVTYSRGSWIGFTSGLIMFIFLLFYYTKEKGKELQLILLIFLIPIIFFNIYNPKVKGFSVAEGRGLVVQRALSIGELKTGMGVATRIFVWKKGLILISQKPWLGHGPETFEKAFRIYNLEYAKKFNDYVRVDRAHNNYLDLAFTLGIPGLTAYLFIIMIVFYRLFYLLKNKKEQNFRLIYIGLIAGFSGYMVNDLFIFSVVSVSPTFWSLIGLTLVLND